MTLAGLQPWSANPAAKAMLLKSHSNVCGRLYDMLVSLHSPAFMLWQCSSDCSTSKTLAHSCDCKSDTQAVTASAACPAMFEVMPRTLIYVSGNALTHSTGAVLTCTDFPRPASALECSSELPVTRVHTGALLLPVPDRGWCVAGGWHQLYYHVLVDHRDRPFQPTYVAQ